MAGDVLAGRFLRSLAAGPARPALHLPDVVMSYEQVHELALRWAGRLLAAAGGSPAAVAVLAGKGVEGYVGVLAALYSGSAVVPLNPEWPAERLCQMITAAGVSAVIADRGGRRKLAETELPELAVLVPADGDAAGSDVVAPKSWQPDDVTYVLFTSGSTGRPKGIPLTQRGYRHYFDVIDQRYDFHPGDAFAQTVELTFDCAIFDLFAAWGAGACVHPLPAGAYRDLSTFAAQRGLSVWFSTPSTITAVRRLGGLRPGCLPGLRWSFFAGEALLVADAADWQAAAPAGAVENLYGPAELTITICGYRFDPVTSPAVAVNDVVPIGAVHPGHDFLLVDAEGRPTDGDGELCVSGPQMAAGYLDPADDRDRFTVLAGRRWYRTGDLVRRLTQDTLAYLGRLDSQVQVKGRRVELSEVDHAVRSCAGVWDAVTIARPVAGSVELVVFYTGTPVPALDLARHLLSLLPQALVPQRYQHLEQFPLNANQKIDRLALIAGVH